jgi:hypothetical protein
VVFVARAFVVLRCVLCGGGVSLLAAAAATARATARSTPLASGVAVAVAVAMTLVVVVAVVVVVVVRRGGVGGVCVRSRRLRMRV